MRLVSAGQLVNLAPYFKKDGCHPASTGITTNGLWTRGDATYGISQDRGAAWASTGQPPQTPFAKLTQVFHWLQKQYEAGYIAPEARISSLGITPVMDQNLAATTFQGAWTISSYAPSAEKNQAYAWAQLAAGPNGNSMTISNSLAQSVLSTSKHPAQAAQWVEFAGSTAP